MNDSYRAASKRNPLAPASNRLHPCQCKAGRLHISGFAVRVAGCRVDSGRCAYIYYTRLHSVITAQDFSRVVSFEGKSEMRLKLLGGSDVPFSELTW